ncbi:MexH family multidrug efflux RND transporter periplasmic adaptor subunit [Kordiimonas sediminis]|uniref:MexH family multidrug efflux RND transporter periplasmic adaptor subunit n=1 Tax=Kordiimonas sediminis TaxID=1735581 RepID=A0A919E9C6_9PROT|nr:efflux RND transporter periplasmic adaptor subunit [Kordiimonas sediminis]GHF26960.1 MexH family multidrug efflux RND transporter periplasmic adaptor subunit [Kordiimonas sediminis]
MIKGRIFLAAILILIAGFAVYLFTADSKDAARGQFGGRMVTVEVADVTSREFSDIVEALGTAKAHESVTLTSRVSDTVSDVLFNDGQHVKKGDILVKLTSLEEEAQVHEAQANFEEAESQFKRIEDLVKKGTASTATLDAQQRKLTEARSRLEAAQARLQDRVIAAPFDGVLGLRQVSEGSLITQSTPITTIDEINLIYLDFSVPERFIATVGQGQTVAAKVDAYPEHTFVGVVTSIDSRVDPATRTVIVRAEVDNSDLLLRPGMLMTVQVTSRTWTALSVPEESVVPTGGKMYVFTVKDGKSEQNEVKLGLRRPGYVEVLEGIEEGDQVVTAGTLRLSRPGMPVRILNRQGHSPSPEGGEPTGRPGAAS